MKPKSTKGGSAGPVIPGTNTPNDEKEI